MILSILIATIAHACGGMNFTPAELAAWNDSPERVSCITACKAKNPMEVNIRCDGGAQCNCSARCFDTDREKFCARIAEKSPELEAATAYHAASVSSAESGMLSLMEGIEENAPEKITFGVESLEAAKEMNLRENAIRARLNMPASPLMPPKGIESRMMRIENKIPRESFLASALESPRELIASLGFSSLENGASARPAPMAGIERGESSASVAESSLKRGRGLREALKRKLAMTENETPKESTSVNTMSGLAPLEVFQLEKESLVRELNLFDVVRLKYRSKERMMKGE